MTPYSILRKTEPLAWIAILETWINAFEYIMGSLIQLESLEIWEIFKWVVIVYLLSLCWLAVFFYSLIVLFTIAGMNSYLSIFNWTVEF